MTAKQQIDCIMDDVRLLLKLNPQAEIKVTVEHVLQIHSTRLGWGDARTGFPSTLAAVATANERN